MASVVARGFVILACTLSAAAGAHSQAAPAETPACTLEGGETRSVIRIVDAETVLLDDHSEVRLIGALAPRSPDLRPDAQPWRAEERARTALSAMVLGRSVSLATAGRKVDRYGRRLAHLFVDGAGEKLWVQGEMLAAGHARAYGLPNNYACMRELLAHENAARAEGAGLWKDAAYAVRAARRASELLKRRNSFEIVAGTVAKVAQLRARTYLNFGRDWRTDFTAGVEGRVLRAHPEWAETLAALEGKRVEVRGWIQYRNGPYIDIEDPSQIAVVDDDDLPGTTQPPGQAMTSSHEQEPETKERPAPSSAPGALDL